MRREGVVCGVEAEDGHRGCGKFSVWTGVPVIIFAGFVAELQSREAFVELADGPGLEGDRDPIQDMAKAERKKGPCRRSVPSRHSRGLPLSPEPSCVWNRKDLIKRV